MTPYLNIAVNEASQVGEARRAAARLAVDAGLDEVAAGRLALVVTELGTNLARHAQRGRLMLGLRTLDDGFEVEVVSTDHGPGMADPEQCLRDGYSTAGTPGSGLGAVRRQSHGFAMFSSLGRGTVVVARVASTARGASAGAASGTFTVGALCVAAPGETVCGDGWAVTLDAHEARLMVADGLGHGPSAAEASDAALDVHVSSRAGPAQVIEQAQTRLRPTRGAAVMVARLDADADTVTFAGVGNIAGRLISGVGDRSLLSHHGTVGMQSRRVTDAQYPWPPHALLVLHSDGIATRWNFEGVGGLLQSDPTLVAAWLLRDHIRGKDDATVLVARRT